MAQDFATWGTLAGTIATAIATFFLWRVTGILAVETKRMADASAQPQVVANIVLNKWAMNHADLVVENTGNATAFDIQINFDPPLPLDNSSAPDIAVTPLQSISILKPGQLLSSYLCESLPLIDNAYTVTISWRVQPASSERQTLSYAFRMSDYRGLSQLGAADPAIQIADQIKKIREDWQRVAGGQRKLRTEIYTEADRQRERELLDQRFGRQPTVASIPSRWTRLKRFLGANSAS